jgi:hypothetical protein
MINVCVKCGVYFLASKLPAQCKYKGTSSGRAHRAITRPILGQVVPSLQRAESHCRRPLDLRVQAYRVYGRHAARCHSGNQCWVLYMYCQEWKCGESFMQHVPQLVHSVA